MSRSYRLTSASLFVAAFLGVGASQEERPRRPQLYEGGDTNSAAAYFEWGMDRLREAPGRAADAFYWASRLDPRWAEPLYARRIALLLSKSPSTQRSYIEGRASTVFSPEIMQIDSLGYQALLRNPFFHRGLDQYLLVAPSVERMLPRWNANADMTRQVFELSIERLVTSGESLGLGPMTDGWLAYAAGRFPQAMSHFDQALRKADETAAIHRLRAGIFFYYGQYDSTKTSLELMMAELRQRDEDERVIMYESKALIEYSLGYVLQVAGDTAGAREAYARALAEDLAFYPAHLRLAVLAAAEHDQEEALTGSELAAQIAPAEAIPQVLLGQLLQETGRTKEAASQLRRAIELEPFYAEPYLLLGLALEQDGHLEDAIGQFSAFLDRANRENPRRRWALAHRDSLAAVVGRNP